MIMPNTFVSQWVEFSQASLNKFKEFSDASVANLSAAKPAFSSADVAELLKNAIAANKQFNDISTATFMKLFHNQITSMNLGNTTSAVQELTDISSGLMSQFVQQQTQFVSDLTSAFSGYVANLQQVNGTTELTTVQSDLLATIQQQVKDNAAANMGLLNSLSVATSAWTEKTLTKAAEAK
jgi:hypothetical protein